MAVDHEHFMRLAIEEARRAITEGNQPFGSVVVRDGEVVGRGRNLTNRNHDPTAHAETEAIRDASATLASPDLSGCTIYATWQPCAMCCGAIVSSGIGTVVLGGRPAPGEGRLPSYTLEGMLAMLGLRERVTVIDGVLSQECRDLVQPSG
jgi:tRNA(adenine34) deaminase